MGGEPTRRAGADTVTPLTSHGGTLQAGAPLPLAFASPWNWTMRPQGMSRILVSLCLLALVSRCTQHDGGWARAAFPAFMVPASLSLAASGAAEPPCPAVGPSPSLRCDMEVLLSMGDALLGPNTEALRTWWSADGIHYLGAIRVGGQPPRVVKIDMGG